MYATAARCRAPAGVRTNVTPGYRRPERRFFTRQVDASYGHYRGVTVHGEPTNGRYSSFARYHGRSGSRAHTARPAPRQHLITSHRRLERLKARHAHTTA